MKLKSLLKLATLLLVVAAMMMPATGCARPRKLSSTLVPSVRTIENVMHKLQNNKTPTLPSGIKMLAKRTEKKCAGRQSRPCTASFLMEFDGEY